MVIGRFRMLGIRGRACCGHYGEQWAFIAEQITTLFLATGDIINTSPRLSLVG